MSSPSPFLVLYFLFVFYGQGFITTQVHVVAKSNIYIIYLGERQHHDDVNIITDSHHDMLTTIVGSKEAASESMVYSYKHGFSGFAAKLTEAQAEIFVEFPGVVRVIPNSLYKLQTTRSWDYLGLSTHTPNNILHKSNLGDGVIIGVLDTGFWPESKAFNDEGLGPIPSHWKGVCESGEEFNPKAHCNRKVIGARWFIDGILAEYGKPLNRSKDQEYMSPRDANGHGTHTSSIAAGSFVDNISYKGLALGTVRGGAPSARLAVYKVCWNVLGGQCSAADILRAFDEAIHDGVDVLSLSIGYYIPLFSEVDERGGIATGSFHAVAKGITVICGAGNDGPLAQTVQNVAPWILTVAASTMDRSFPSTITLGNNKTILGHAIYTGKEIGFTGLLYPESKGLDLTSAGACEALLLDHTWVTGKVVLCFTLLSRFSLKIASSAVKEAGGVGVIIAKNPRNVLNPCSDDLPCVEVDYTAGTQILHYIRSTRSPMVKLSPSKTLVGEQVSPNVAYFSSRGPSSIAQANLKPNRITSRTLSTDIVVLAQNPAPDITAPGVSILGATSPLAPYENHGFAMLSGTSMSTPHVSGIVALLKALHPHWSPAAIKSALVTTAWTTSQYGFPIFAEGSPRKLADPFDFGGGIVNPNGAADPGLVYDMDKASYIHYLCAKEYNISSISRLIGGQPTLCPSKRPSILDVNLPSITIPSLRNSTTLTRTVTNVGPVDSVYRAVIEAPVGTILSVRPQVLLFNSGTKKISFKVTVSLTHQMNTEYYFGSLTWTNEMHAVRSPVSVRAEIIPYNVNEN